ncbi:HaeIII family restriction endonuclease [Adlercreutzia sp. ZJ154]|uniref:HaeIII family restriction endonuclease n=1 Tax=Adlercreutzia sp. ZJ154 TaxID=2709790 RepID=UPI0013EDC0E6|nr:HaeIII family restriction endonuclease [Adlercreutzia sp. ZJ154]
MTNRSNDFGRAYEFVFINLLKEEIQKFRPVELEENSSYFAAKSSWGKIDGKLKRLLKISASVVIPTLFDMEPLIVEDGLDCLELKIQKDSEGIIGDVRDILIIRRNINWEIGLSLKHNHFAVKHSRLSSNLDFGEKWFGVPCSKSYWDTVTPIFDYLKREKQNGTKWKDLPSKEDNVYIPLLLAFIEEINKSYSVDSELPAKLVEYLLGFFDFYKIISLDNREISQIQAYNIHGTLNKSSSISAPKINIPVSQLPTRIVSLAIKPGSNNTVELYMNNGWQFSFRIHNASTKVEPSLKFDIQIIGMPVTVITINCSWVDF